MPTINQLVRKGRVLQKTKSKVPAMEANPQPAPGGKRIKLRYITQAGTRPPRFVIFGTRLDLLPKSYERYLVNGIRAKLGFDAVPVRVTLKTNKNPYAKD